MTTVFAKRETVRARLVRRRRDRQDARPARHPDRHAPASGKHKANLQPARRHGRPHRRVNAEKIRVTGNKLDDKIYYHHTGAIGGIKTIALGKLLKEHPERAIEFAVKGMLPKNPLGRKMFKKLHVFAGDKHPHAAQQPKPLEI